MREIQYRGKSISTGEWVYGNLIVDESPLQCLTNEKEPNKYYIGKSGFADWNMPRPYQTVEVIESTIGEWTGLTDKDGIRIYEGDIIRVKTPVRTTQTHTGPNIPNGSYTEPMEPGIEIIESEVYYKDGVYSIDKESRYTEEYSTALIYEIREWIEWEVQQQIGSPRGELWDDPEEGDLQYLLEEYGYKDLQHMLKDISGIKVIGNIHNKDQ